MIFLQWIIIGMCQSGKLNGFKIEYILKMIILKIEE